MKKRWQLLIYLGGTFVSSLGGTIFYIFLMIHLIATGTSPLKVSIIIGLPRLATTLSLYFLGQKLDRLKAQKLLLFAEFFAAGTSVLLLIAWGQFATRFVLFVTAMCLRAIFINLQNGVKSKVMRAVSGADLAANSKTATWLNQATHSSVAIAACLGFFIQTRLSLESAIVIDMISFIIGGASSLVLVKLAIPEAAPSPQGNPNILIHYFQKFKMLATADLLLALSFAGLSTLIFKLSQTSSSTIALLYLLYGGGLILAGPLGRAKQVTQKHSIIWLTLAAAFGILGAAYTMTYPLLLAFGLLITAYWVLFNRYSALIQHKAPSEKVASIVSARNITMVLMLACGEFVSGYITGVISVQIELFVRAVLCIVAVFLFWRFPEEFKAA